MRIHNLAIETRASETLPITQGKELEIRRKDRNCDGDRFRPWHQSDGIADPLPQSERYERKRVKHSLRDDFCDHLEMCGHKRPAYSKHGRGTL